MIPEELRIQEYAQAMQLLEQFKHDIEAGEVMSLMIVAERPDGSLRGGSTAIQNIFAMYGYLQMWFTWRFGFMKGSNDQR